MPTPPTLSEMEESLVHYGVKGMRWGVRKSESSRPASVWPEGHPKYGKTPDQIRRESTPPLVNALVDTYSDWTTSRMERKMTPMYDWPEEHPNYGKSPHQLNQEFISQYAFKRF